MVSDPGCKIMPADLEGELYRRPSCRTSGRPGVRVRTPNMPSPVPGSNKHPRRFTISAPAYTSTPSRLLGTDMHIHESVYYIPVV
jgi:hypothetical protein